MGGCFHSFNEALKPAIVGSVAPCVPSGSWEDPWEVAHIPVPAMDKVHSLDLLAGLVVKHPPSNEGNVGSITGWGAKIPHARSCAETTEPEGHDLRDCVSQLRPKAAK